MHLLKAMAAPLKKEKLGDNRQQKGNKEQYQVFRSKAHQSTNTGSNRVTAQTKSEREEVGKHTKTAWVWQKTQVGCVHRSLSAL